MTTQSSDRQLKENAVDRLIRWFAAVSILPAILLPLYNQFLHGGRDAGSIVPRSAAYAEAHMLGAACMLLVIFGLIAIYLKHAEKFGKADLLSFMIVLLAQMLYAGNLFVDGFFNPLLAKFDPVLQTQLHFSHILETASHGNYLSSLFGSAYLLDPITSALYLTGFVAFGIAIVRVRMMPRTIGLLFIIGGILLSIAIMIPQWLESIGYAAIGGAIAWAGIILWKRNPQSVP